jgi:hypothetical protein
MCQEFTDGPRSRGPRRVPAKRQHVEDVGNSVALANAVFVGVPAAYVASGSLTVTILVTTVMVILGIVYLVIERTIRR